MTKIISEYAEYEIDEYPRTCKECPFLQKRPYRDNAYTGVYYLCDLNYMDHGDTREFDVLRRRWKDCDIEHCKGVYLSGYFKDESLDEKDIEYITAISHGQLEKMRKLAELTKWMSIDDVEKVLHAYEALADLATILKHE